MIYRPISPPYRVRFSAASHLPDDIPAKTPAHRVKTSPVHRGWDEDGAPLRRGGEGGRVCVCSAVTREILQNGILFRGGKRRDASDVPSILLLRRNSITLLKDLCDGFCPPVMRCSLCFVPFLSFLLSSFSFFSLFSFFSSLFWI